MQLKSLKILRGPNRWSSYRTHLVEMRLDLGDYEAYPTNKINGFADRIKAMIPSLYEHRCSERKAGGFFKRVERGTWLGHVLEHIALEIQTLAGMDCGYGRTRGADEKGVYNLVFTYTVERAGIYAAHAAFRIVQALVHAHEYDINKDIKELERIKNSYVICNSNQSVTQARQIQNM